MDDAANALVFVCSSDMKSHRVNLNLKRTVVLHHTRIPKRLTYRARESSSRHEGDKMSGIGELDTACEELDAMATMRRIQLPAFGRGGSRNNEL